MKKFKSKKGMSVEIKLRDETYQPIYKAEARSDKLKELAKIIMDLEDRGVPFSKAVQKSLVMRDDFWEI